METKKIKGIWWTNNNPENQINGVLEFLSPKNCYLVLDGTLEDRNIELIKGFSKNGKPITLYNCFQTNLSRSSPGLSTSKYFISYAFINVEYNSAADITFKNFSVNFSTLDEWANKVDEKFDADNYQSPVKQLEAGSVQFKEAEKVKVVQTPTTTSFGSENQAQKKKYF